MAPTLHTLRPALQTSYVTPLPKSLLSLPVGVASASLPNLVQYRTPLGSLHCSHTDLLEVSCVHKALSYLRALVPALPHSSWMSSSALSDFTKAAPNPLCKTQTWYLLVSC